MSASTSVGNPRDSGYVRNAHDWYQEPRRAVDALLEVESFAGYTYDPACGSGNIPKAFLEHGLPAYGSDIVDRGYGVGGQDFLSARWLHAGDPIATIVTNPPFGIATEFLLKSLDIASEKVCILQRLSWLEGKARREIFERTPLARVWVFSSRISMPPGGRDVPAKGGAVAYAWFVWSKGHQGSTALGWLP